MRVKFTIAYDGSAFSGWQSQPGGRTVQDVLEGAVSRIADEKTIVHGAGRTDAGVHALGQTAHVDLPPGRMDAVGWQRALNGNLPPEIRIIDARRVPDRFHARFSATGKIYRYHLCTDPVLPPHAYRRAWRVHQPLDPDLLRAALTHFIGQHDFTPFSANRGSSVRDPRRTIRAITVAGSRSDLRITFEGDGFLYKMVRMMTAAAVRTAIGKAEPDWIPRLLLGANGKSSHVAPADGLFLVRVLYR